MRDLKSAFEGLTPKQRDLLLRRLEKTAQPAAAAQRIPRQRRRPDAENAFPLSYAQQRLWFMDRMEPGTPLYNIPAAIEVSGRLDVAALAASLGEIVRRHEALRTTFTLRGSGHPMQVIQAPALRDGASMPLDIPVVDLREVQEARRHGEASRLATIEARRSFELQWGPLLRALVVRTAEEEHLVVLTIHHIVSDGWSMGVLVREIAALYPAFARREHPSLPELPLQYADFAVWQREWLQGDVLESQLSYWRRRLAGAPMSLDLPVDHPRPQLETVSGAQIPVRLPARLTAALRELSRREGGTLFMTLLTVFAAFLQRWTGQDELLLGTPIANRNRGEIEGLIGFFVNTLALRVDLRGEPSVRELLTRVRDAALSAYANQDLPFEKLVEELQPQRDLSRSPIFQVMFTLQPAQAESLELPGLRLTPRDLDAGTAKFELLLHLAEGAETVSGWLEYNTDLFDTVTVQRMAEQMDTLLVSLSGDPSRLGLCVDELRMSSAAQRHALLWEWNDPFVERLPAECLHGLVELQARLRPETLAIVQGDAGLTYGELDRRAGLLAGRLRALGVRPESRVALCMDRVPDRVAALLGVLKAGGAYVPLDAGYPVDRLAFMLEDTGARVLVTQEKLLPLLPVQSLQQTAVICLDGDWADKLAAEPSLPATPETLPDGDNLAYIIYTSGSTGRPKGVMVRHRGACRVILHSVETFGLGLDARVPHLASLSFDASVLEIFSALAGGGTVAMLPADAPLVGGALAEELRRYAITFMAITPSLLDTMPAGSIPSLRGLALGGESSSLETVLRWERAGTKVLNCYAPTETTIYSTTGRCLPPYRQSPPMGRPIAEARVYLLDRRFRRVPAGALGELFIGGTGVARGYLNRPRMSAERFVPDPWSGVPGARLYRTGDMARQLPDGRLEFAGRFDSQVKIRGFRIELGEIESALAAHPAVERAEILVREDTPGDKRLVAYVVPRRGERTAKPPSLASLRSFLRDRLPGYMVPGAFVVLDKLPMTPTGKVDRKALPVPGAAAESGAVLPRNEAERAIAAVWREVLSLERVGVDDNFFDLGGHSLLMAQVHARLCEVFDRDLTLIDLFRHPTIAALAAFLSPGDELAARPGEERALARLEGRAAAAGDRAVAVVGLAGRFPGANGIEAFWESLAAGAESITFFTDEQLAAAGVPRRVFTAPGYIRARGIVDGVELFDAGFFGYNPREAELMDPQQRVFLECAWEAFEDAGYDPARYPGDVGVYAGVGQNTYMFNLLGDPAMLDSVGSFQATISNDKDFLAPRVSYKLGLKGPSVVVQTACSTSLVAVHMACQAILDGECDAALAGGVSIRVPQQMGYQYRDGAVFSPDGHCRAFDAAAGGFVGGNGAGVVLLKRLADALRDGDRVHAVIRGSAINNDGSHKVGFTAPSVEGQAQVIAQALTVAGVEPSTIGYVEAHGTGTDLGDPIEIAALTEAFGPDVPRGACLIGSVKTNIGHLDSAAGVTGLIKAVLALEHRQVPPTLHFEAPNPKLGLETSPFRINADLTHWPAGPAPRRAGVSSMGIGGTNAHVILEEAPEAETAPAARFWQLLCLSARSEGALASSVERLAQHLRSQRADLANAADIAYTLHVGRRRFAQRAAVLARDLDEAATALETGDPERLLVGAGEADSVAFLLSGQGSQHPGMAAGLYEAEDTFREQVDLACDLLLPRIGLDLRSLLFPAPGSEEEARRRLARTELTQPALFVVEHALARQWMAWGVRPAALLGHSVGEYVAACLAGVFSLEDALTLVAERGRLMGEMAPGAMLAVSLSEEQVTPYLGPDLSLAAVNGPARSVVSGPEEAVAALEVTLAEHGVQRRRLHTSHAYHSAMMEPALEPYLEQLRRVRLQAPRIPFVSNVTGRWITAEEATDPGYWVRQLRGTVRFADGVAELLREPGRALVEVGPGNALTTLAREIGAPVAVASLPHPHDRRPDHPFALTALARLWLAGVEVDWQAFHGGEHRRRVSLPGYPFERQRYWVEGTGLFGLGAARKPDLSKRPDTADWLHAPVWKRMLAQRRSRIDGTPGDVGAGLVPAQAETDTGTRAGTSPAPTLARWLVFQDGSALGAELVEGLRAAGAEVTAVRESDLDPGCRDGYVSLLRAMKDEGGLPSSIVHLWSLESSANGHAFEHAQARGLHSLLFLAQALGEVGASAPVGLTVVSRGLFDVTGDEALRPEASTLLGAARTIPWEYPNVTCRVVDVVLAPGLAGRLLAEVTAPGESLIALRGPHRWMQTWEQVCIDAQDGEPAGQRRLRDKGVYLVTGGLGGVGLEIAEQLYRSCQARLVLVGRTALPDREAWARFAAGDSPLARRIRRIRALEARGAEVLVLAADVADRDEMARALDRARERFGTIHGVVHAAGVSGGGPIQRKRLEDVERVLAPRVVGLQVLEELLQGEPLDLLVLVAGLGGLTGEPGQADLCAAHAYFDAWAQARGRNVCSECEKTPYTVAIDWDTWREVGMAASAELPEELRRLRDQALATGIAPAEGREVFGRIVSRADLPQIVVSTRDLGAVMEHLASRFREGIRAGSETSAATKAAYARPELRSAFVEPRDETEEAIAAVWRELLGLDRVGVHDNFFDLGGHSLLATQVMTRVRETLGVELPLDVLFERADRGGAGRGGCPPQ